MGDGANDNRFLEYGCLDPDRHYVEDYLSKAVAHFRDCKIHPETINEALARQILALADADPADRNTNEGLLWSDVLRLWDVQYMIKKKLKPHLDALRRIDRRRRTKARKANQPPAA